VKTSLFIIPRASTAWRGNEAGWITASGWAAAGQQRWGEALVATTDGVFRPEESRLFPRGALRASLVASRYRRIIPEFLITAYKDLKLWKSNPPCWPIEDNKWVEGKEVMMVWQRHDLFAGPGRRLANKFHVPLVTSVEATVVWEARKWGVYRPIWGNLLEHYSEAKALRESDLVSCVSEEVREKVIALGVSADRAIVSPNGVDSSLFHPRVEGAPVLEKFKLQGRRVIGWTGSFRSFHGLDSLLGAFRRVHQKHPDTVLMLVGDGQELDRMKHLAVESGLMDSVLFPGRIPFTEVPSFVAAFDIAVVTAASAEGFHYSPLKLKEYLALGRPVIAARAGDLPKQFSGDSDLLFYEAGNVSSLSSGLLRLLEDDGLRERFRKRAADQFAAGGTWLHELENVCAKLGIS
jgi:glycosyltransferase involved in cell wall biosynthesis